MFYVVSMRKNEWKETEIKTRIDVCWRIFLSLLMAFLVYWQIIQKYHLYFKPRKVTLMSALNKLAPREIQKLYKDLFFKGQACCNK